MSILLLALAGLLLGGAWSLQKQGKSRVGVSLVGGLGALSLLAGILWLLPGSQ